MRRRTPLLLLALSAALAVARLRTFDEPLERDLAAYAVLAHEMLEGRELYTDLWDHKPPAVFVAFAAAELLFGYGPKAIYALNVLCGGATIIGVYALAAGLTSRRVAGLWAATFWAVVSGDLGLQGNQPNTEALLNPLMVWALVFLVRALPAYEENRLRARGAEAPGRADQVDGAALHGSTRRRSGRVIAAGTLLALASLVKPVVWPLLVLLAVVLVGLGACSRRRGLCDGLLLVSPTVVAWLTTGLFFLARGGFEAFWEAVFAYNRAYAGDLLFNLVRTPLLPLVGWRMAPLVLLVGAGIVPFWRWAGTVPRSAGAKAGRLDSRIGRGLRWKGPGSVPAAGSAAERPPARTAERSSERSSGRGRAHRGTRTAQEARPMGRFALAVAWVAGVHLAVAMPGQGHPHYYQLWLPLLCVFGAWSLTALRRRTATGAAVLAMLLALELPLYALNAEEWSRRKYGEIFIDTRRTARLLEEVLAQEESFVAWSNEPGLYFETRRSPPTGVVYAYPLLTGPLQAELTSRVVEELEANPPVWGVVNLELPSSHAVPGWIRQHLHRRQEPAPPSPFELYGR